MHIRLVFIQEKVNEMIQERDTIKIQDIDIVIILEMIKEMKVRDNIKFFW
jgi:trehalose-6-phosphate synthase